MARRESAEARGPRSTTNGAGTRMAATSFTYVWIAYLAVALILVASRNGNVWLVLGLLAFAANGLLYMLLGSGRLELEELGEFAAELSLLPIVATGLLLFGVLRLGLHQRNVHIAHYGPAAENVATLILPRAVVNTYARAEALRDAACRLVVAGADASRIKVITRKSNPNEAEIWFRVDFLLAESDPNVSLRASVTATVHRYDFFRFENLFYVETQVGTEITKLPGVISLDAEAAMRIHRHITTPGNRLSLRNQVREYAWQLWRPRNKITRLRPDWAMLGASAGAVVLALVPVVGPVLTFIGLVALIWWSRHRRTYVLTSGRPLAEPRRLTWMDSWQVTVGGLGAVAEALAARVRDKVGSGAPKDLVVKVERIAYWSIDGQVYRDQISVRHRRALGFVHIVPYGSNLYVGWECHLNSAAWVEEALARGVDKVTGVLVHANQVVPGHQPLNEYDLADANFLSEWLHEVIKRELTLKIAEHKIDQMIDFTVQRASRQGVAGAEASGRADKRSVSSLFKRTG